MALRRADSSLFTRPGLGLLQPRSDRLGQGLRRVIAVEHSQRDDRRHRAAAGCAPSGRARPTRGQAQPVSEMR